MSEIPDWEDPRRVLGRHGLGPKRSMSQNFLVSRPAVEKIAEAVVTQADAAVVELGPGLGTLTTALLRRGARVTAIERDRDMLRVLNEELGHLPQLRLVEGDAAQLDLSTILPDETQRVQLTGNLPYAITGAILRRIGEQAERVEQAVVMVQREVRDRMLSEPGVKSYGALTVFTQARFEVSSVLLVPPGSFHPPPRVSSAVIRLRTLDVPRAPETPAFRIVVKAAFEARRKTLRNALLRNGSPEQVDQALQAAGIDGKRRGETLSIEEFGSLASAWHQADDTDLPE